MVGTEEATTPTVRVAVGSAEYDRASAVVTAAREAAIDARIVETGPTGAAGLAPMVMATADERTAIHTQVTPARARELVETLDGGEVPTDGAHAVVESNEGVPLPETGPLAAGRRRVLARCGRVEPTALDESLAKRTRDDPGDLFESVAGAGLLGRGRGDGHTDEPIAEGWETASESGEAVVVVNGNESDPAISGDRLLLESRPVSVLDSALAVAAAVDATDVIVYLGEDDDLAARRVREAVESVDAGETGIDVVAGPDSYTAGEMTMALESMEGAERLEARLRPPGPSEVGLYGRPTVIHTPRTLAQVRAFAADPGEFESSAADPGTRLLTVTGDGVAGPTTVELATDTALAAAVAAAGGGEYKMACVGGRFGGITRSLDVPASAPALASAHLGTEGGIELFDGATCALELAGSRAKFAREENCGRCVPCREGSKQLVDLLRDVYDGQYQPSELRELSRVVAESSTCEFGQAAPRPVTTAMDAFEREIAAHAEGRCPSGVCMESD